MEQALIDSLLELAKSKNIAVYWSNDLNPYTPPAASPSYKSVVMNEKWYKRKEIPFQLAHEISHILNKDPDNVAFYHATFKGRSYYEAAANERAINVLIPIYCSFRDKEKVSVCQFMDNLSIPSYLEDCVSNKLKRFYD